MGYTGQKDKRKEHDSLYSLRHSAAHVMAQAVKRLYPETKLAIGPPIEDGFYYDMEVPVALTEADLPKIEAEIENVIRENHKFVRSQMSKAEAIEHFKKRGERYKLDIISDIPDEHVSIYTDGEFVDLCEGPHVGSTRDIKAIKLLSVAGAYWRGNEKNPQLQRIYGTAFLSKEQLKAHLTRIKEAKRRDHRRLGSALGLFSFEEEAGPGVVFYHPNGALVRSIMEDEIKKRHLARDYQLVATPHIFRRDLWERSGHLEHYKDYMFLFRAEGQDFGLKPMNCPAHILIYRSRRYSYRELPVRFFELGTVYRNEKSGVLHGLMRVRGFTQDDAHIFLSEDQLVDEIERTLDFAFEMLKVFGFTDCEIELSTRPEDFAGAPQAWEHAEASLRSALERGGFSYDVHEGEGAFYGPKIDLTIKDALGRRWQCGTIQCDFALPERFDLTYDAADGREKRIVMIHRALLGSLERFLGILLEHYAGALPLWLSPVQVMVIPVGDRFVEYALKVVGRLRSGGLRAKLDARNEKMQARIRDAQLKQVPYMAVVGQREAKAGSVSVRHRRQGDVGAMDIERFAERLRQDSKGRLSV